ncbi:MAG: hypothetical protein ACI4GC_08960 [Acutalibacteraceae bacterium]
MKYEATNDVNAIEEPDWGILMFWEDLTYILTLIADFFKGLFGLE